MEKAKRTKKPEKKTKTEEEGKTKKLVQSTLSFSSSQKNDEITEKEPQTNDKIPESEEKYRRLKRDFFSTDVVDLSKKLLGKIIRRNTKDGQIMRSRIVETEAYKAPEDKGCHAYNNNRTKKTEAFWCKPGSWYVYTIYMPTNKCLNIVAAEEGVPEATLIRAAEPIEGIHLMQENTDKVGKNKPGDIRGLTNGPGKLGRAMDIGLEYTCYDFCEEGNDDAFIEEEIGYELKDDDIVETFRVNIDYAEDWRFKPWRFFIKGNKCVSVKPQTKEFILSKGKGKKKIVRKKKKEEE